MKNTKSQSSGLFANLFRINRRPQVQPLHPDSSVNSKPIADTLRITSNRVLQPDQEKQNKNSSQDFAPYFLSLDKTKADQIQSNTDNYENQGKTENFSE